MSVDQVAGPSISTGSSISEFSTVADYSTATTFLCPAAASPVPAAMSPVDSFFRRAVTNHLRRLSQGQLWLQQGELQMAFGSSGDAQLTARLQVYHPRFYQRCVLGGAVGAAESYLAGEWMCSNLVDFIRLMLRNEHVLRSVQSVWTSAAKLIGRARHCWNRNSRSGSRRNIQEHYDLGNDFFALFLDETMMYSSGMFPTEASTLKDASIYKLDQVCQRLQLTVDDHVLEIGTGWGGFALHAAEHYGCRVTTTTISDEQYRFASEKVKAAGLEDKVTVLRQDYRDLSGSYDKLVSIEMIEAVGRQYLNGYFQQCHRLLQPGGKMLIQAITMPEQRYTSYVRSVDFIQKYIFPGGFLPSITELQQAASSGLPLRLLQLEDFGIHYARTLNHWRQRFHARLQDVREQGFNERFIRMWHYYLCYCEAAFLERATGVVQAVWIKPY